MEKKYTSESRPPKKTVQKQINPEKFRDDLVQCAEILKKGGVVLLPEETGWGLGCDATNPEAVKKIKELNPDSGHNALTVMIEHPDRLGRYVKQIPEIAIQLMEVNDKPMTLVYPGIVNLAGNIADPDGSAGIRITNDSFCKKLIASFNKPIVLSMPSPGRNFKEIPDLIKSGVDYIVKWRQNDLSRPAEASLIKVGLKGEVEILKH